MNAMNQSHIVHISLSLNYSSLSNRLFDNDDQFIHFLAISFCLKKIKDSKHIKDSNENFIVEKKIGFS